MELERAIYAFAVGFDLVKRYHSLKSPLCSCVSITVVGIIVKLLVADIVMRATLHIEAVTLQQLREGVVVIIPAHEQRAPAFTVRDSRQPDSFPLTPI